MASRDLFHSVTPTVSIAGQTATTSQTGSAVDTQGYESVTVVAQVAAIGGTSPTYAFKVQDCDTSGGTYADVDATCYMAGGAPAAVTANGILTFGMKDVGGVIATVPNQLRRFLKAVCTVGGTTPTAIISAIVVLGHPKHRSVAV